MSRKIPPQKALWTTRELETIRICDMDDGHLVNTINMLLRNIERTHYILEGAPIPVEDCVLTMLRVYRPTAKSLLLELLRRHVQSPFALTPKVTKQLLK